MPARVRCRRTADAVAAARQSADKPPPIHIGGYRFKALKSDAGLLDYYLTSETASRPGWLPVGLHEILLFQPRNQFIRQDAVVRHPRVH
jgi:hypothetical protein